jgi:hypothetical protein
MIFSIPCSFSNRQEIVFADVPSCLVGLTTKQIKLLIRKCHPDKNVIDEEIAQKCLYLNALNRVKSDKANLEKRLDMLTDRICRLEKTVTPESQTKTETGMRTETDTGTNVIKVETTGLQSKSTRRRKRILKTKRPRGRPPKNSVWDEILEKYVNQSVALE